MMTLLRRSMAVLLAFSLLIPCFALSAVAEDKIDSGEKTEISQYEYLLDAIGVISIDEDYMPNEAITRIELVKNLISMMKIDVDAYETESQIFLDVPLSDSNFKYANCAYKMGIVNGYEDGSFGVNDTVSMLDATVMICRAMGYQKLADMQGGYPGGYMKLATSLKLYSDMGNVGEVLKNADACCMIYNALSASTFETNDFETYKIRENSTLFGILYDLSYVVGVVQEDASGSILNSDDYSEDELLIDGIRYEMSAEYSHGFLGKKVKAYYTGGENDIDKIVYMHLYNDVEVLVLNASDIVSVDAEKVIYDDTKTGKKKEKYISPYAVTVKNGNIFKLGVNAKLNVKNGTYSFVDNDGDGKYDYIIIKSYRTVVVESVATALNSIYDTGKGMTPLQLDDYEEVVITDTDGKALELKELQKDACLRVEEAENKRYIRITVVYNTNEGTVKTIKSETDRSGIRYVCELDNGKTVKTSTEYEKYIEPETVKIGTAYKFLLDFDGNVIYIKKLSEVLRYGWLKNCKTDSGIGDTVKVKMLTTDGSFETYTFSNKIKLNGYKSDVDVFMKKWNNTEQLVRYRSSDEGILTEIETAGSSDALSGFKLKAELPSSSSSYTTRYYSNIGIVGGKLALDNNTVVFSIPEDGDDNKYGVNGKAYVVNQAFYPLAKGYSDASKNGEFVDVLVVYEKDIELDVNNAYTATMLVKEITEEYDSKSGNIKKLLCGYSAGEYTEYSFRDDIDPSYTTAAGVALPIEEGDVVWFGYDGNKRVNSIKILFDQSTRMRYGNNDGDDESTEFGNRFKVNYGTPYSVKDGLMRIVPLNTDVESGYLYPINTVYLYDNTKRGDDVISIISSSNIETLYNNPELKDKVFFVTSYQNVWIAVIYKEN